MRFVTILLLLLCGPMALAQREDVIQVPERSATELYRRADRWFVDTFKDANSAVQLRDSTQKLIVAKGQTTLYFTLSSAVLPAKFTYSVEAACRDGRCKTRMYDMVLMGTPFQTDTTCIRLYRANAGEKKSQKKALESSDQLCRDAEAYVVAIMSSMRTAILREDKSDW